MPFQLEVQTSEQRLNREHVAQLLAALVLRYRTGEDPWACEWLRSECTPSWDEGDKPVQCTATRIKP